MILHIIIDQNNTARIKNIDYDYENTHFKLAKSHYLKGLMIYYVIVKHIKSLLQRELYNITSLNI